MDDKFINRTKETEYLSTLIKQHNRVNIIFSKKGIGKTALINNLLKQVAPETYIYVDTNDLLNSSVTDFYFIQQILETIVKHPYFDISKQFKISKLLNKFKSNASISLGFGFLGIDLPLLKSYKLCIDALIDDFWAIDKNIYIHIENIEKIDDISLKYILQIIGETKNVIFFFECSDNIELCNKLETIMYKKSISVNAFSINQLEWSHVSVILKNLNLFYDNSVKKEYDNLNGNIKELIFNNKHRLHVQVALSTEQQYILNFINLVGTELSISEMHIVLISYNGANRYLYSLVKIKEYVNDLVKMELIASANYEHYYITESGLYYIEANKNEFLVSILSNYYLPSILDSNEITSKDIKALHILINIYLKHNDKRILKLLPYIEPNLIALNGNKNTITDIYNCIKRFNQEEVNIEDALLLIAKSYIKLSCYEEAKEILQNEVINNTHLSVILHATVLIHLDANEEQTEEYILKNIERATEFNFKSALYTCLINLYMQIKPTSYVMNYIETFDMSNLTTLDYYIIQKNISIYLNNNIAISKLNECCNYFEVNNYNRLVIASQITLATKHAQIGEIKQAKEILEQIYENKFLGMQDVIYIENNMAVFDFLEDNITEKTLNKLKAAFAFCNDEYTHLLIINNILIYYVQSNKFKEASLYAEELETIGYKTYCFDDYLHLTILNLRYYYSKINASNQIAKCNLQLKKLRNECYSNELKEYITTELEESKLDSTHRWFYMSSFKFRPAFLGHWIINDFDS